MSNRHSRFDMETVRDRAGDKTFARGETYYRDGLVEIRDRNAKRVLACVTGSDSYRTLLTGKGRQIGGECSCPAFEESGFCKHMVAVAFAANQQEPGEAGDVLDVVRRYLLTKDAAVLTDLLLDLAEHDESLFRRLEMEALVFAEDDKKVLSRLRKAINSATHTGSFIDYRHAGDWAAEVEVTLDAVEALVSAGRAAIARTLAEHALYRIEEAIEELDDSDGHAMALMSRAQDIHLAACGAEPPEPIELAGNLFEREVNGDWDVFSGASELYAEILGEAGLAEYRRLANAAWEKIPPRHAERHADSDAYPERHRLVEILDSFAARDGDIEARIALRTNDLSSPWRYLELAKFCREQGRDEEALRHAEEGLWLFEDDPPDERLVMFVADMHQTAGRVGKALETLRSAFDRRPSLALYERIRSGGAHERESVLAALRRRLTLRDTQSRSPVPADLLIQILIMEAMFDEAWQLVGAYGVSSQVAMSLAQASEASHPKASLAIYATRVDQLIAIGGNHNYQEACALIGRMAFLRGAGAHTGYVDGLKMKFKAKRNFMKLLAD